MLQRRTGRTRAKTSTSIRMGRIHWVGLTRQMGLLFRPIPKMRLTHRTGLTHRMGRRLNDSTGRSPGTETTGQRGVNRATFPPEPPTEFQRLVTSTTGRQLQIYGASMFSGDVPSTFAPVSDLPVTPDYVIGPGDELRLQVWGQVNQQGLFVVDRTGAISVPQLGTVHVAGQQYGQLNEFLRERIWTGVPELQPRCDDGAVAIDPGVCGGAGAEAGKLHD